MTEPDNISINQEEILEEVQKALAKAYRLISYRDRSTFELNEKLCEAGFDEEIAHGIIKKLTGQGLINDKNFALNFALFKSRGRLWGPRKISHELRMKGINPEDTEEALSNDEIDFNDNCFTALTKWLKRKNISTESFEEENIDSDLKNKAIKYLESKGYFIGQAIGAIKKL